MKKVNSFFKKHLHFFLLFFSSLILFLAQVFIFRDVEFPLTAEDNIVHYDLIQEILMIGKEQNVNFYPFGTHYLTSFLVKLTGLSIEKAFFILTAFWVSLVPFSFYYLASVLSKDKRQALYTGLLTLVVYPFVFRVYYWGGYPFLWGLTLVWAYTAFFIETIEKKDWKRLLILLFLGIGLFLIHSPEMVTAFFFLLSYALFKIKRLIKNAYFYLSIFLTGFFLGVLNFFINPNRIEAVLDSTRRIPSMIDSFWERLQLLWYFGLGSFLSYGTFIVVLFFVLGLIVIRRDKNKRKGSLAVLFFLGIMSFFYVIFVYRDFPIFSFANFFYELFFPWGDRFRFFEFFIFGIAYVSSLSIENIKSWLEKIDPFWRSFFLYLIVVFCSLPIPGTILSLRIGMEEMVPSKELLECISYIGSKDEKSLILNDVMWGDYIGRYDFRPTEFVSWLDVLTSQKVAFPYIDRANEEIMRERVYVIKNLKDYKTDSLLREHLKNENIEYVIWDERTYLLRKHQYLFIEDLLNYDFLELEYVSSKECLNDLAKKDCVYLFKFKDFQD